MKTKIEVTLWADRDPENTAPEKYCAVVLGWHDGPTYRRNAAGIDEILPGTENGGWHNEGIVCWGMTPEAAFTEALTDYRERERRQGCQKLSS